MIYVLTGPIRTGKTQALKAWAMKQNDVDGLLCPDNAQGKRYFLEIKSNTEFPLEVTPSTDNETIAVGPFLFLKSAFDRANKFLKTLGDSKNSYVILDELGKLELKSKGLHEAAESLIPIFKKHKDNHLIIVVRDTLLASIILHYNILNYQVLTKETLEIL
jgi:nucleoside-triphosphatase THEP1